MRDYRDAKLMAASLKKALAAHGFSLTHSQSLEAMAKAFGVDSWNVLAAQVEAARRPRPAGVAWRPGEVVVVRHVHHDGTVWSASAAIVVEDRPMRLVLY